MKGVDWSKLVPSSELTGDDEEDTILLQAMLAKAEKYVEDRPWCKRVISSSFGLGVGGIVAIFLFHIEPRDVGRESIVWIIVGDIPSASLTTNDVPNPACALQVYISALRDWISAVRSGCDVNNLIPVDGASTEKNADALSGRLEFIERNILAFYKEDLAAADGT